MITLLGMCEGEHQQSIIHIHLTDLGDILVSQLNMVRCKIIQVIDDRNYFL